MSKTEFVKLNPKSQSFYDQQSGLKIKAGQQVEVPEGFFNSAKYPKIASALRHGHISRMSTPEEELTTIVHPEVNTTVAKVEENPNKESTGKTETDDPNPEIGLTTEQIEALDEKGLRDFLKAKLSKEEYKKLKDATKTKLVDVAIDYATD